MLGRRDEEDDALLDVGPWNLSEQRAVGPALVGTAAAGLEHNKCVDLIFRRRSGRWARASATCGPCARRCWAKRGLWQVEQAHHRPVRRIPVPARVYHHNMRGNEGWLVDGSEGGEALKDRRRALQTEGAFRRPSRAPRSHRVGEGHNQVSTVDTQVLAMPKQRDLLQAGCRREVEVSRAGHGRNEGQG